MVKNPELLRKVEDDFSRTRGKLPYDRAIRILEDMWREGVHLGVLPPREPLEGIEVDIRVAKVLNSCLKNSSQG